MTLAVGANEGITIFQSLGKGAGVAEKTLMALGDELPSDLVGNQLVDTFVFAYFGGHGGVAGERRVDVGVVLAAVGLEVGIYF